MESGLLLIPLSGNDVALAAWDALIRVSMAYCSSAHLLIYLRPGS